MKKDKKETLNYFLESMVVNCINSPLEIIENGKLIHKGFMEDLYNEIDIQEQKKYIIIESFISNEKKCCILKVRKEGGK